MRLRNTPNPPDNHRFILITSVPQAKVCQLTKCAWLVAGGGAEFGEEEKALLEKLMAEIAAIKEQLEATDKVSPALVTGRAVASVASCRGRSDDGCHGRRRCRCNRCCCASPTLTHAVSSPAQEWRKTANRIDQDLVPILPLDRTVNVEILLDLLPKKTVSHHDIAGV